MRAFVNSAVRPRAVPPASTDARDFHRGLPGYRPTRVVELPALAAGLAVGGVWVKDESDRHGLPAFKVLGASWAIECALREQAGVTTLVAASAGNHGRAVARVASGRGLACRVFLPSRSVAARREAIAAEGADVVVVDGSYEDAVAAACAAGREPGALEIADLGDSDTAQRVIDGYATLFDEALEQIEHDLVVVPVGVGSLAAAAARFGARHGIRVVGVEPVTAACLTSSLAAGRPVHVPTPGTAMAGLDCAEVSVAAWPSLRDGMAGTITVSDAEARSALRELASYGLRIGESGSAALAGLRALAADDACAGLRRACSFGRSTRVLLVATEGPTDPEGYEQALAPG